ncbi:MAG: coenzyme F420-0:L-glutamate ligase, partial [Firmicutes bacterium]|nr:coenzyme F420-0:L-glutamate ligase [Bacillota bacterium]
MSGMEGPATGQAGHWLPKAPREVGPGRVERYVVRTHLVQPREDLVRNLSPYLAGRVRPGDIVCVGEKVVAIAEGRVYELEAVRARWLARFLAGRVRQLGYGLGLRRPETMEMAIREVGSLRIMAAAAAGALDRLTGRSGDFYRVAGRRVSTIDGPGPTTIPPYNRAIVLGPRRPELFARRLARRLGCGVAVVDVNDVGSVVLARSPGVDARLVEEALRDNPMGQGSQQTPVAVLRPRRRPAPGHPRRPGGPAGGL